MINCKKAIEDGICKADCCGPVVFPKQIVAKNIEKVQREIGEHKDAGDEIALLPKDGVACVFLTEEYECAIYDDRPDVCKRFGCGRDEANKEELLLYCPHFKPNGNPWSPAKKKQLQRLVNHKLDYTMKKVK